MLLFGEVLVDGGLVEPVTDVCVEVMIWSGFCEMRRREQEENHKLFNINGMM